MKTLLNGLLALMLAAAPVSAFEPLLERRAKLDSEQEQANFDARMDLRFGTGVMARLIAAAENEDTEDVEMMRLYLEGVLTEEGAAIVQWKKIDKGLRPGVIDHIAAKDAITPADARAVWEMTRHAEYWPQLEPRHAEILAHYPDNSLAHYFLKYTKLRGLQGSTSYLAQMTDDELMKATTGVLPAKEYDELRQEVLSRCIGATTRFRRDAGLPNDAESFGEAMTPILEALNSPLWEGLAAATAGIGLDFTAPDYSGLIAELTSRDEALDERRIPSAIKFAGSMVFWKGTEGYLTWAQNHEQD